MSERETRVDSVLQQWRGVDQRTQPTLVKDGFFVMARGVYFGLGGNAERIPGKTLSTLMAQPVFNIVQVGQKVIIQGLTTVWICDISDLT